MSSSRSQDGHDPYRRDKVAIAEFLWHGTSSGKAPLLPPAGEPVEARNIQVYNIDDHGLSCRIVEYSRSHVGCDVHGGPKM